MATVSGQNPDGRPLYAYKCKDSEYRQLKDKTRAQMPAALRGGLSREEEHRFAAMFCVYAAETFRRRHEGGPWKWETVFAEIGYTPPDNYQQLYDWVEIGLRLFKRPLLKSRLGHREFLVTLACEGGLPLLLLRRENAHLSRYFRELLTACHRERHTPEYNTKEIAHQIAARYLPASLRHDVVFKLSGDLIRSIIELQEQVDEADDPIASLDRLEPEWRQRLPLPVEDDTVEILLRNLVGQARTLAQTERQRWRWRCFLVQHGEYYSIEQHLELPRTIKGVSLQNWSGWAEPSARLQVLLQTPEGIAVIALLTRLQGTGEQATYQCETLRQGGVQLIGKAAEAGCRLLLSQGNEEVELPMVGGQELGPLPWVFVERDSRWELCGEGSVRRREASVRMLALDEGQCLTEDGTCEPLGKAPELERSLYQVAGTVDCQHPELGSCQIRCASQEASEDLFLLKGRRLLSALNPIPPFLGMPALYAVGQDGRQRQIADGLFEWRPLSAPESEWRQDASACAGKVWVRYRDTSNALRFRRQVEVVPPSTHIEMARIGARAEEAGIIRFSGLSAVQVIIPEVVDCRFDTRAVDKGVEIDCFAQVGLPVTQFDAELQWPDGRSLTLMLPFPRQGAAFVRAGQVLPPSERVALGRLASIQAIVQTPNIRERFYLEGKLKTHTFLQSNQELWEPLRTTSETIHFALHRIQERLASMLAMTGDLDAVVSLKIVNQSEQSLAHLEVALFDVLLEPDQDHSCVLLPPESLGRLNNNGEEGITVKMLPLWTPSATPVDLDVATPMAWKIPDELEPGPWWVLGYDGDWARFRPLLWAVEGEKDIAGSGDLVQAIHESDPEIRQEKLQTFVENLAANAEHSEWTRLSDYLRLTRNYPASSIDLFQHLVQTPEAVVMALLRSTDEEFDLIWSLSEQLPFSWYLVPVTCWLRAAKRRFDALRVALDGHDSDGRILESVFEEFRQRVTSRQPFFRSVCDWIGEQIFPNLRLDNSELAMARAQETMLVRFIQGHEKELQERHDSEERYPSGPDVMELTEYPSFPEQFLYRHLSYHYRPVRCAPFVAAQISLNAEDYSEALLFELRQLRNFDPDWFDNAFALALCLGLARRPAVTEGICL